MFNVALDQIKQVRSVIENLGDLVQKASAVSGSPALLRLLRSVEHWQDFVSSPHLTRALQAMQNPPLLSVHQMDELHRVLNLTGEALDQSDVLYSLAEELDRLLFDSGSTTIERITDYLAVLGENMRQTVDVGSLESFTFDVRRVLFQLQNSRHVDRMLQLETEAERSVSKASEARKTIEVTSAEVSESKLATQYLQFAKSESTTAGRFRVATIVLIVIGILAAMGLPNEGEEVKDIIYRLAVIAAVFGLAGYLARQANHHRRLSVWGSTISVQLHTFEGFLSPIDSDEAIEKLRLTFGARVFGAPPESKTEPSESVPADLLANAVSLISRQNQPK